MSRERESDETFDSERKIASLAVKRQTIADWRDDKMTDLKVWMRVGDQDDYHSFDSIDEATNHVHEYLHWPDFEGDGPCQCPPHKVERYVGPGLIGLVFPGTPLQGDNGVSFYWGDDDAQLETEISEHELEVVQRLLS